MQRFHDLKNWMAELPKPMRRMPLSKLILPGTHSSAGYRLDKARLTDRGDELHRLDRFKWLPAMRHALERSHLSQALGIIGQLEAGIRQFDFCLSYHPKSELFYFSRDRIAFAPASAALQEIATYLSTHHGEVVVIRVSRDPANGPRLPIELVEQFLDCVDQMFGPLLIPNALPLNELTLERQCQLRQRVLFSWRHKAARRPWLWHLTPLLTNNQSASVELKLEFTRLLLGKLRTVSKPHTGWVILSLELQRCADQNHTERTQELHRRMYDELAAVPDEIWANFHVIEVDLADERFVRWVISLNYSLASRMTLGQ